MPWVAEVLRATSLPTSDCWGTVVVPCICICVELICIIPPTAIFFSGGWWVKLSLLALRLPWPKGKIFKNVPVSPCLEHTEKKKRLELILCLGLVSFPFVFQTELVGIDSSVSDVLSRSYRHRPAATYGQLNVYILCCTRYWKQTSYLIYVSNRKHTHHQRSINEPSPMPLCFFLLLLRYHFR